MYNFMTILVYSSVCVMVGMLCVWLNNFCIYAIFGVLCSVYLNWRSWHLKIITNLKTSSIALGLIIWAWIETTWSCCPWTWCWALVLHYTFHVKPGKTMPLEWMINYLLIVHYLFLSIYWWYVIANYITIVLTMMFVMESPRSSS